ncbi:MULTISPECIES: chemotaxis protein CheA [Shewanella]|uniref:Chemotaxis protein CheA n=1 Tax=Shewanella psychromarinicola TaxID=2487742 RepID=A0A3N4DYZ8_9GAMM|nr:chemotaxis protein CheA [Shewanella psychromarinicola]AZG35414.1 chemotaxis protein CheA [Shewanella psychromarinicola]MCL1084223.1 chemotaxis protein CheA [Shewanella psychromarinicola]RPA31149.1 chemotaxis protein CheA [Shewanella psychromarinicola]
MDELEQVLGLYISESRELLDEMESLLLNLEQEEDKNESLSGIFRAAHTIKGSAGIFSLDDVVNFTHGVESLLDKMRDGKIKPNTELTSLLLNCKDHISLLIDNVEHKTSQTKYDELNGKALLQTLTTMGELGSTDTTQEQPIVSTQITATAAVERVNSPEVTSDNWHISVRYHPDSFRFGMDPLAILRYLATLGKIESITTLFPNFPSAFEMDPETCYLGYEINFNSQADKLEIEGAFEFIRDDSQVHILPPSSCISDYIALIKALPEQDFQLGEILVQSGSLTPNELEYALGLQRDLKSQSINMPLGSIVVNNGLTPQPVLESAIVKQNQIREVKTIEIQSIRVDAEKLDQLINLVGELVIAGASSSLHSQHSGDRILIESFSILTRLVEEVRDAALQLRMVQIGVTFNRFQRVVRDVAKELGKDIELVITGAETELDKTVVEKISDPLMHLVRNSMDHGIEAPDVRMEKQKPPKGRLCLNAYHDSGMIVIEVSDDGAGLNHEKILKKAQDRGLIKDGEAIDIKEINNLIFEPGFSTADAVTNLSGRGVGMDVVKRNITALRGTVEVQSAFGKGAIFSIRLPLTLATIEGFLVEIENSSFVIPLNMVLECVELNETNSDINANCQQSYINLRGEVLPFIRLRRMFNLGGNTPNRENVIVVSYLGSKVGLAVDKLVGEFQTVIKPLGNIFSHIQGISGSTVLGSGEVALILDVPSLVQKILTIESAKAVYSQV